MTQGSPATPWDMVAARLPPRAQGGPAMNLRELSCPYFGEFGGRFVPDALIAALEDLTEGWQAMKDDPSFHAELQRLLRDYVGRPSPITEVPRFAEHAGGMRVFLKREDLNHTGSHKINNVLGQALLTRKVGKQRVIAETGAGQHGVATATAAALFGLECTIYMGAVDVERQALNVARMRLLGAEVIAVETGSRTLKDAINEAFRDWVTNVETTNYIFGTVAGPHPFPEMVRDLQKIIGEEAKAQLAEEIGALPSAVIACVGGGSNAMGIFHAFLDDDVRLIGAEAAGEGVESDKHAATITKGSPGVLHGAKSYLLQNEDGQTVASHSISAGLDYPGVGPEHSYLASQGRAEYRPITDAAAMSASRCSPAPRGSCLRSNRPTLAATLDLGKELAGRGRSGNDVPARLPVRPRR